MKKRERKNTNKKRKIYLIIFSIISLAFITILKLLNILPLLYFIIVLILILLLYIINVILIKKNKKIIGERLKNKEIDVIIGTHSLIEDDIEFSNSKVYVNDLKNLDKFIKNKAKSLFLERLDYWYSVFLEKIPYPKLRIRVMKTRWGVCNRKNNTVTLNLDLIKYSVDKLDYVIIHELSHFVHFNHSESFWKLVSKYCPDYKKIRKELRWVKIRQKII